MDMPPYDLTPDGIEIVFRAELMLLGLPAGIFTQAPLLLKELYYRFVEGWLVER